MAARSLSVSEQPLMLDDQWGVLSRSTKAMEKKTMTDDVQYIQVGDLAKGITENLLPDTDGLAGKSIRLHFQDGTATEYRLHSAHGLTWAVISGDEKGSRGEANYRATCPRQGIFFVDFVKPDERATTVSLVLDINLGIATSVIGTLPTATECQKNMFSRASEGLELTTVSAKFMSAALDRPFGPNEACHSTTAEMVGKRVQYVYSRTETYEHIYLNEKLYTWQCLSGIEKGLADTDRCHYYKIADELYLFVWREKIVPTLGVVVIDLRQMKTTGKLFGYESNDFGKLVNAPVGAFATLLNVTRHA
jgi:hypothetical protein